MTQGYAVVVRSTRTGKVSRIALEPWEDVADALSDIASQTRSDGALAYQILYTVRS